METTFNINEKKPGDNGYVAMFNGQSGAVYAPSQYEAEKIARAYYKPRKSQMHRVYVMIAERADGSQVIHSTSSI